MERFNFNTFMVLAFLTSYACHTCSAQGTITPTSGTSLTPVPTMTTYGNITGLQLSFVPEPRGRGTVGIVISCSVTLFFCVWTTTHPNILPGVSDWDHLFHKGVLVFLSLFIPEGILIAAMRQARHARNVCKAWNSDPSIMNASAEHLMCEEIAFFIVMGGFIVDQEEDDDRDVDKHGKTIVDPKPPSWLREKIAQFLCLLNPVTLCSAISDRKLPDRHTRPRRRLAILTPKGFTKYLKDGYIHQETFDPQAILDRNKSSTFAKFLAGGQALWLVVDCAARWGQDLPITLLEVHVLIQVLSTLVVCYFWLEKPLNVNEPIRIKLQRLGDDQGNPKRFFGMSPLNHGGDHTLIPDQDHTAVLQSAKMKNEADIILYRPSRTHLSLICKVIYDLMIEVMNEQRPTTETPGFKWIIVLEFLLVISSGVFHAVAWNSHFPTVLEQWLWRLSSIGICVAGISIFIIAMSTNIEKYLLEAFWRRGQSDSHLFWVVPIIFKEGNKIAVAHAKAGKSKRFRLFSYFWMGILLFAGAGFVFLYWYCVYFITIESYVSMRSPLEKYFITPTWTNYLPHL